MSFAALQNRSDPAAATAARMGLSLGPKHDAYEHEANRVGSHVAQGGSVAGMSLARLDLGRHTPDPARRRADPATNIPDHDVKHPVQRKPDAFAPAQQAMQPAHVQRPGGGQPLDVDTRHLMETRFDVSFERVRIHTGQAAAQQARALHAVAYTIGTDIYFAENRYAPNSKDGRELLAHELTHVVQQSPSLVHRPAGMHAAPASIQRSALDWIGDHIPHPIEDLERAVRKIPGYRLVVLILGKDPFDDTPAPSGATSWVRAFLDFIPGGNDAFTRLQESGALEAAYNWLHTQLASLGLSTDSIYKALKDAYNIFVDTLPHIQDAVELAMDILIPEIRKGEVFIGRVFNKLIELAVEFALKHLGGDEVVSVLKGALDTFFLIAKDPVAFLKHLIDSVWKGFTQFSTNLLDHLKEGAMTWLFGSVPNIKPRKPFNLAEILRIVLEITGLTWHNFRTKLVKVFGSEDAVDFLENSFDFIMKIAHAKSLAVAWEMILDEAKGLIDTVIGSVKQFVMKQIVTAGVEALLKLFSPVGALVQAVEMIYHFVTFIINKKDQLVEFVRSVTASVRAIATGDISNAANAVEGALAKGIAPALGLLAAQVHLGDIGEKIHEIVGKVQKTISDAIDRVVAKVADKAKLFYARSKAVAAKVVNWFTMRKELLIGDEEHAIYMEGTEDEPRVMIASDPKRWSEYLDEKHKIDKHANTRKAADHARELEKPAPKNLTDDQKKAFIGRKHQLFNELADLIVGMGFTREVDAPPEVRYSESRMTPEGGAYEMSAIRLRKNTFYKGTDVSDNPAIYTRLPRLRRDGTKKTYVQGHLLNRKLGGIGKRFNLTPLTNSVNQLHESSVEGKVKAAVLERDQVMAYRVNVTYGDQTKVKTRIQEIEAHVTPATPLTPAQQKELDGHKAEAKLATRLDFTTAVMTHEAGAGWKEGTQTPGYVDQIIEP